jgi:hypothetical protein
MGKGEPITIAVFSSPVAAQSAKADLEAHGIECFLFGEFSATSSAYVGGGIQLAVSKSRVRDAMPFVEKYSAKPIAGREQLRMFLRVMGYFTLALIIAFLVNYLVTGRW